MRAHPSARVPNAPVARRSRKRPSPTPTPSAPHVSAHSPHPAMTSTAAPPRRLPQPDASAAIPHPSAAITPSSAMHAAIDMRRHAALAKRIVVPLGSSPGAVQSPQAGPPPLPSASPVASNPSRDDYNNNNNNSNSNNNNNNHSNSNNNTNNNNNNSNNSQPPPHLHNEISRERFILTGGETGAPIMPAVQMRISPRGKEKPRSRTCWEFVPFNNGARKDGLKLTHWQRVGTPAEYSFARFNRPIRLVTYTDEEYAIAIEPTLSCSAHGVRMRHADSRHSPHASLPTTPQHSRVLAQQQKQLHLQNHKTSASHSQELGIASNSASLRPGSPNASSGAHTRRASAAAAAAAAAASSSAALPPLRDSALERSKQNDDTLSSIAGATGGSLRKGMDRVPPQKPWTKQETDELFRLCEQFDLRFVVVHDRWPVSFPERSVDDLKDRYYTVAKALIEFRSKNDPSHASSMPVALHKHCQAIVMNPFDYEYECIRKNQLEWQYRRSKAELREEEETVREARRIEANRRRLIKERQRLAKLLTPAGEFGAGKGVDAALAAAASSATPQKTFPHRKVSTGPFARSSLVFAPVSQSSKVCKRVDAGLEELNVTLRPMPTCTVVDNFDLLRIDILNILELNRTVAKKEEEVYSLIVKLAKAKGEPIPPPPPGVPSSHKKRRLDDVETGPIFGGRV